MGHIYKSYQVPSCDLKSINRPLTLTEESNLAWKELIDATSISPEKREIYQKMIKNFDLTPWSDCMEKNRRERYILPWSDYHKIILTILMFTRRIPPPFPHIFF